MMSEPQSICIGIPTFRRPDKLGALLKAFDPLLTDRPCIRVCVVNDGSHDESYQSLLETSDRPWLDYRVLETNLGCGGARHATFENATETWFVSLDDDCVPSESWLSALDALTSTSAADLLAGEVKPIWASTPSAYVRDLSAMDERSSAVVTRYGLMTAVTANMAVRRSAYELAGGFRDDMRGAEDCDLTQRLIESGATYQVCPHLVMKHIGSTHFLTVWKRFRSYGDHAARYVLLRGNWRIASQQPEGGVLEFLQRVAARLPETYSSERRKGYSRWRSGRRVALRFLLTAAYEQAWHKGLRRHGRSLGRSRPTPPQMSDMFVDFGDTVRR